MSGIIFIFMVTWNLTFIGQRKWISLYNGDRKSFSLKATLNKMSDDLRENIKKIVVINGK